MSEGGIPAKAPAVDEAAGIDETTVVLAAIDTSPLASRVVDLASRLARRTWPRAELHVLHVFQSSPFDRPEAAGFRPADLVAEAQQYLDFHVRMARRQFPGQVVPHLAIGNPASEIIKAARLTGADMLLVGTHELAGIEKLLRGSIAAKVVSKAPCSVLVVRPKQRPARKVA